MNNFDSPPRVINKTDRTYPPRKLSIAMIAIIYGVPQEDGQILECSTWAAGVTPQLALLEWRRRSPVLAAAMLSYSVAVQPGNGIIYDTQKPVGKRIKVHDELLEQAAVGL